MLVCVFDLGQSSLDPQCSAFWFFKDQSFLSRHIPKSHPGSCQHVSYWIIFSSLAVTGVASHSFCPFKMRLLGFSLPCHVDSVMLDTSVCWLPYLHWIKSLFTLNKSCIIPKLANDSFLNIYHLDLSFDAAPSITSFHSPLALSSVQEILKCGY